MSHQEKAAPSSADMGLFERYLSLWVAAAIVAGIALGQWLPPFPRLFHALNTRRCRFRSLY